MEVTLENQAYVGLELKYCERCGGLWLRPRGSAGVYCRPCHSIMAALPCPRVRRGASRSTQYELDMPTEVKELMAFCVEGGVA